MTTRTPIGFRTDRFTRLSNGQLLNVDAVRRLVPCFTCGATVAQPCTATRGSSRGRVTRTHQLRAYNEEHNGGMRACPHEHSMRAVQWFARLGDRPLRTFLNWSRARRQVERWANREGAAEHLYTVLQPDLETATGGAQ